MSWLRLTDKDTRPAGPACANGVFAAKLGFMTKPTERPYLSRAWVCLLIGIGLTSLGAVLAIGWLLLADAMAWEIGAKLTWPGVLGPLTLVLLPPAVRLVWLARARYRREGIYTLMGAAIGIVLAAFGTLVLIGIGLAAGMPRHY
jgi:hypothetical protein